MSRQSLIKFLTKLDKELYGSSAKYRREADGREMVFTFNKRRFVEELRKEFDKRELLKEFDSKSVQAFMEAGATKILNVCGQNAAKFKQRRGILIRRNQHSIKVVIATEKNPSTDKNYNNFIKLKELYKSELNSFVLDLNEHLKTNYGKRLNKTKIDFDRSTFKSSISVDPTKEIQHGSDLLEAGHEEGEGILESRMSDAIDTAINQKYMRQVVKDNLQTNFKELGISLKFVRDDATDTHSIFAQSKVENRETGFDSAKEKTEFRKQLKAALVKLNSKEPITELKGSDSIEEFKTKQVTYDVMTEFKKAEGKYVKVSKVKKPKATKRSAVDSQKKQKSKVVRSEIAKAAIPKTRLSPGESRTGPSMFSLAALINQKLPETVEKNMGPPALTNVTGRFANSVRVTDVVPTAQGFPSIGYTYRKSPYQTFETGNKQGDAERDPRKLINRSIREIAAEMAIGRFYTRRV